MNKESIYAEARANGSTNKEAQLVCEIVEREVAAERERCAAELDCRAESWAGLVRSAMKTAATAMRNGA